MHSPRTLLVTGGAGFIGLNFLIDFLPKHPEIQVFHLDALTPISHPEEEKALRIHPNYHFVQGDITDFSTVDALFRQAPIDGVIHFAACTHVDQSISTPLPFVATNVLGTAHLLWAAQEAWMEGPFVRKENFSQARFLHISTDEVYGSLPLNAPPWTEDCPLNPHSPYSASKASADHLVQAFHHTYGLPTLISRCTNNYGPYQSLDKWIPKILHCAFSGTPIPVYGDGLQRREWTFVGDHTLALQALFDRGKIGEIYHIGGGSEISNLQLITLLENLAKTHSQRSKLSFAVEHVADRPGHDTRYALDDSKIRNLFSEPPTPLLEGLAKTFDWYESQWKNSQGIFLPKP